MPCVREHKVASRRKSQTRGTNRSPGCPVGRSGPSTPRPRPWPRCKVGRRAAPRVEARWGACQRTVRGADDRVRRAYLETVRHPVHLSRASMSDSARPPRPRALFVAALLLLTLALAGVLALQSHRTFLDQRATAERVLPDNAPLAAPRFAHRVGMEPPHPTF